MLIARVLTFAGLPSFCPITFHLLASYSLIASRSAADYKIVRLYRISIENNSHHLPQTRHSACPDSKSVEIHLEIRKTHFVPVLFDTSFCPCWKRLTPSALSTRSSHVFHLCNLAPAIASIAHLFQPLFFRRCPRRICSTTFLTAVVREQCWD